MKAHIDCGNAFVVAPRIISRGKHNPFPFDDLVKCNHSHAKPALLIFISNLTLCRAPLGSIVKKPWIPLHSGGIMGPQKSKTRGQEHGLKHEGIFLPAEPSLPNIHVSMVLCFSYGRRRLSQSTQFLKPFHLSYCQATTAKPMHAAALLSA